ncbi:DUF503 domain-containing protein [Lentibacillus saliphilus]|uniref:DUF503 domain-containing protein n=1 Tax=Lentibacillus saliphilus TaxID=2737028 RepID=UPI001C304CAC|nr:DUF503 domain-containing protein [Lentibacillus saliphilus]
MILLLEVECFLYNAHSLKEKRSVLKKLLSRLRREFNVSVAELDNQDLWQRTKIGIVTIANDRTFAEQVIDKVLTTIDACPELERTITDIHHL